MKPTVELLQEQFTHLIGPEAFAKAETAIAAAKAAAEAAAKAAAEKAAAAAAAARLAAENAATAPVSPTAGRAGTPLPASPATAPAVPATASAPAVPGAERSPRPTSVAPVVTARPPASPGVAPRPATAAVPPTSPAAAPRPAPAPAAAAPRPAPALVAPAAPLPTLPVQRTAHAAKGYDFDAVVAPEQVVQAAHLMDDAGFGLDTITGVDWIAQNEMEVVYDFFHPTEPLRAVVRTRVPRAKPELPTITPVFAGANWHERETHDFFGIVFTGHPNLKPFLLPEDADFHPLRKDYQP